MTNFKVPAKIEQATERLNSLGELVWSSEWKRAAIVRAYVRKQQGKRTSTESSGSHTVASFAKLKIVGLSSQDTVRRYYDAWDLTELPEPEIGKPTELPELEFPALASAELEPAASSQQSRAATSADDSEAAEDDERPGDPIPPFTEPTDDLTATQTVYRLTTALSALDDVRAHGHPDANTEPYLAEILSMIARIKNKKGAPVAIAQ